MIKRIFNWISPIKPFQKSREHLIQDINDLNKRIQYQRQVITELEKKVLSLTQPNELMLTAGIKGKNLIELLEKYQAMDIEKNNQEVSQQPY